MPGQKLPEVDHFVPVEPSKEPIEFVELKVLDFSKYNDGPEARKQLAEEVRQAMTTQGFFTIINHGISQSEIERQVDIGHTIFKRTPPEEKESLKAPIVEKGSYFGFKPRGHWRLMTGKKDNIENFNVSRDMKQTPQPTAMKPFIPEIQKFIDFTHNDILFKIYRLFAIALEINDEDFFVKLHSYEKHDESWLRYMEYYDENPVNTANGEKTLWLGGHQDLSALSLLFSQPMSSLQVRDYDDDSKWKYVAHTPGAIIVNAGEIVKWWTGDYFKAAIHRVIEPPKDQRGHDRSSVFYFAVPNDDVVINTLLEESPVLRAAGVERAHRPEDAPTSKEWVNARVKMTGQKAAFAGESSGGSVVEKVGKVTTTWFR
ncbi:Clavaminate synthase-like protein [Talaromyces proteolyticus]|uniref:Clavaminate synthase-like protein n=1 Tax=Talaromyces proteolyticus TaxID=1131652 RepID=A0AAD4KTR6_9EURO|nr:Clavaminate synthase-like protein [Talaromyces proteolyticus]KAH8699106.1 Clavaminate synthase-like protein [Talaromyces proteolyticus]